MDDPVAHLVGCEATAEGWTAESQFGERAAMAVGADDGGGVYAARIPGRLRGQSFSLAFSPRLDWISTAWETGECAGTIWKEGADGGTRWTRPIPKTGRTQAGARSSSSRPPTNPSTLRSPAVRSSSPLARTNSNQERILLLRISALLRPLEPKAPAATATNPNPLPPISLRLPANSPAVSHGALEDAAKGGGMAGMMQGMLGGGGEPEVEEAPVVVPKKKIDPRLIKPRRVHVKQR